jgi:hypothetical protein
MSKWNDHLQALAAHLDEIKTTLGPEEEPKFITIYNQLEELAQKDPVEPDAIHNHIYQMYNDFPAVEDFLRKVEPELFIPGTAETAPVELAPVRPIPKVPQGEVTPPVEEAPGEAPTPAQPQPQVTPPVEVERSQTESELLKFKEYVTAIVAGLLVLATICLTFYTVWQAGDNSKISQSKDILMLFLGPFGTVLGYYFGRVPADARAAQAQQGMAQAAAHVEQINAKAIQVAEQAEELTGELEKPPGVRGMAAVSAEKAQRLRADTRELIRLARRR